MRDLLVELEVHREHDDPHRALPKDPLDAVFVVDHGAGIGSIVGHMWLSKLAQKDRDAAPETGPTLFAGAPSRSKAKSHLREPSDRVGP